MNKLQAVVAAACIIAGAPASGATTFQFDTDPTKTFVNVTSNTTTCRLLGTCPLTATLEAPFATFVLEEGESKVFNFARISIGPGIGVGSATLDAQLGFLLPSPTQTGTGGSASYFRIGGRFTPGILGGSLTWDQPNHDVVAANGATFRLSFGNIAGAQFGASVFAPVTIQLVSDAVPEPASWAMVIVGFGAVGRAMRSARRWKAAALTA